MVSRLVDKDTENRTLEEIMSSSEGPDICERVQMACQEHGIFELFSCYFSRLSRIFYPPHVLFS